MCDFLLEGQKSEGRCFVVSHPLTLLGRDWISKHQDMWNRITGCSSIHSVQTLATGAVEAEARRLSEKLQATFLPGVFTNGLGQCTKMKASLKLQLGAQAVFIYFIQSHPAPYAVLPQIETELKRLQGNGVLSSVTHADFAAPIVIVKKKTGEIRLCADFSSGLNEVIKDYHYPLPTPKDIFTELNGGRYFLFRPRFSKS
jgi:hypothetical protein